jgi:hypothetical protein
MDRTKVNPGASQNLYVFACFTYLCMYSNVFSGVWSVLEINMSTIWIRTPIVSSSLRLFLWVKPLGRKGWSSEGSQLADAFFYVTQVILLQC